MNLSYFLSHRSEQIGTDRPLSSTTAKVVGLLQFQHFGIGISIFTSSGHYRHLLENNLFLSQEICQAPEGPVKYTGLSFLGKVEKYIAPLGADSRSYSQPAFAASHSLPPSNTISIPCLPYRPKGRLSSNLSASLLKAWKALASACPAKLSRAVFLPSTFFVVS